MKIFFETELAAKSELFLKSCKDAYP